MEKFLIGIGVFTLLAFGLVVFVAEVISAAGPDVIGFVVFLFAMVLAAIISVKLYESLKNVLHEHDMRDLRKQEKILDLQQKQMQLHLVKPSYNGLLPVPQSVLENPQWQLLNADILKEHQVSKALPYANARTPTSLTYSPRYSNKVDSNVMADDSKLLLPPSETPNFWRLVEDEKLPNDKFLLGFDASSNEPVTADWRNLYSALVGGQSGSGKSTAIRNVLAQSALQGGKFLVIDPHYDAGEESLGQSLQPLKPLMLADVAHDDKTMLDTLSYIMDIGNRRLNGDTDRTPVVLVVDEVTALFQRSNVADKLRNALQMISTETRKVGVYAFCIGQNFDGRIMDTTVRNNFVSMIGCRMRKDVGRVMSGNTEFGKKVESLTVGQMIWQAPTGEQYIINVPNCTQNHLQNVARYRLPDYRSESDFQSTFRVVSDDFQQPSEDVEYDAIEIASKLNRNSKESQNDAESKRILALFSDGNSMREIVRTMYEVSSGSVYNNKLDYVQTVIRSALRA